MEKTVGKISQVIRAEIHKRYQSLFTDLESIVSTTSSRVTAEDVDPYFEENINFLTKSFLISLCCYLEAYSKELANAYVADVAQRVALAKIPHNLLYAATTEKTKKANLEFKVFELPNMAENIDAMLSGNPFKTADCLKAIGVDLNSISEYKIRKELIHFVVAKRNKIVHHNDFAMDISLGDVKIYCGNFKQYIDCINQAFENAGFN